MVFGREKSKVNFIGGSEFLMTTTYYLKHNERGGGGKECCWEIKRKSHLRFLFTYQLNCEAVAKLMAHKLLLMFSWPLHFYVRAVDCADHSRNPIFIIKSGNNRKVSVMTFTMKNFRRVRIAVLLIGRIRK